MIKEVIDDILEAEAKADEIIKAAGVKAKEIATAVDAEIEVLRKKTVEEIKQEVAKILEAAGIEAEKQAALILKDSEKLAENLVKAAEKNMQAATEFVAEMAVKIKGN